MFGVGRKVLITARSNDGRDNHFDVTLNDEFRSGKFRRCFESLSAEVFEIAQPLGLCLHFGAGKKLKKWKVGREACPTLGPSPLWAHLVGSGRGLDSAGLHRHSAQIKEMFKNCLMRVIFKVNVSRKKRSDSEFCWNVSGCTSSPDVSPTAIRQLQAAISSYYGLFNSGTYGRST